VEAPLADESRDPAHQTVRDSAEPPMVFARRSLVALATGLALGLASGASALNLAYGDVAVNNLDSYGFTATNSQFMTDWNGTAGTDQLYQMYGYVGTASGMTAVNGSSFRTGCNAGLCGSAIAQTGVNTASSTIVLNQNVGVGGTRLARNALTLTYDFTLVDDQSANDFDQLAWDISFTNNTGATLSFVFYTYLDLDLLGTPGNDLVSITNGNQLISVLDSTNTSARPFGWSALNYAATNYQVGAYPGLQNTLNAMTSAGNLSNTNALASTAGDVTAAFQYSITLAPGQTLVMVSAVGEPETATMLALGLGGLAFYARPRRRVESARS
jgi:hypothetical protein